MTNCAVITGILDCSGGAESNLWVLYLLPILTACLLLDGRQAAWITAGAGGFNGAFVWQQSPQFGVAEAFQLSLKTAIFALCAAMTWSLIVRKRARALALEAERRRLQELSDSLALKTARADDGDSRDLEIMALAHDLKNSFTAILGFTRLMADEESLAELKSETRCVARSVKSAEEHLAAFLRRGADNAVELVPDDINEILRSGAALFDGLARPAGLKLKLRLHEPLPPLLASRGHLHRLFVNLVSNAVHALPRGGEVTITTEPLEFKGLSQIRVTVEDDGPGIPEGALARLFQAFGTTRRAEGGTGLGLYNCAEIARQHNGRIHAENRAGGGARFELFLPAQRVAAAAPSAPPLPGSLAFQR
jgi:signal transduction histidine kinase